MNSYLKIIATCIAALLITACGTTEKLVVKEVSVPVPIPCNIIAPKKPPMPLDGVNPEETDIFVWSKSALGEIELRKGYEHELEAAITSCNSK